MEGAFELGLQGFGALKRKEKNFPTEDIIRKVRKVGKPSHIQQSIKRHFGIV